MGDFFLGNVEGVSDELGPFPDVHLEELSRPQSEEGRLRLRRHRPRQQSLERLAQGRLSYYHLRFPADIS